MGSTAQWVQIPEPPETPALLAAGISPLLAPLLARRGIGDGEAARSFLEPSADQLHDPFLLAGMAAAVDRLQQARDKKHKVGVVGDYDVDGVSGTALLVAVFRTCGIAVQAILPNRLSEGYGFQYIHFLQPNQYVDWKPLTDSQRKTAFSPRQNSTRYAAEAGYRLLIAEGAQLRSAGVRFVDLTGMFTGESEPIFRDDCCHFFERGYEIVAQRIASEVAAATLSDDATSIPAPQPH